MTTVLSSNDLVDDYSPQIPPNAVRGYVGVLLEWLDEHGPETVLDALRPTFTDIMRVVGTDELPSAPAVFQAQRLIGGLSSAAMVRVVMPHARDKMEAIDFAYFIESALEAYIHQARRLGVTPRVELFLNLEHGVVGDNSP